MNIYTVLAYLMLPASAAVQKVASHFYLHVFKYFKIWDSFTPVHLIIFKHK